MFLHIHIHIYIYTYIYVHVCIYIYMYVLTILLTRFLCIHKLIYTHKFMNRLTQQPPMKSKEI